MGKRVLTTTVRVPGREIRCCVTLTATSMNLATLELETTVTFWKEQPKKQNGERHNNCCFLSSLPIYCCEKETTTTTRVWTMTTSPWQGAPLSVTRGDPENASWLSG